MGLPEVPAPETGAKSTLPEGVDSVALNQQLELVFGGDNLKLENRMRRNAANMVAGRGVGRRSVDDYLDKHEVGKKAKEMALVFGPMAFGAGIYKLESGRLHEATQTLLLGGLLSGPATEVSAITLKLLEGKFPKLSGLAKRVAGARSSAFLVTQISAATLAGFTGARIVDALTPDIVSATAGAGAGQEQTGGHFGGEGADDRAGSGRHFGGFSPDERGGVIVQPPVGGGTGVDVNPLPAPDMPTIKPPVDPAGLENFPKENFGQQIDVQKIVDSLPKHVGVAQLPESQQLEASHWRLAEAWSKPLANTFGLSDSARTFFTDAVKDMTQDQGNIRLDTVVNYDSHQIGDYLAEAVARLKETDPAGWQVKVSQDDLERLQNIAGFLKNSK